MAPLLRAIALALATASHLALAPPPPATPPATYPNGTANPFYPCGYDPSSVAACPYRCYTGTGTFLPQCYTATTAAAAIAAGDICVACTQPRRPRDYPGGCQPLSTYFNASSPDSRPSPCGAAGHRLKNCPWICAAAQTPFSLCDTSNTTSTFRRCERCVPQCSSPSVVFEPPARARNFSLSAGSCQDDAALFGGAATVACPFRCQKAGTPNAFCSLLDKTDENQFLNCTRCG